MKYKPILLYVNRHEVTSVNVNGEKENPNMKHSLITKAVMVTAITAAVASVGTTSAIAAKKDKEKCYGVVKAGKNDCGNAAGTHSCAGQAAKDNDGGEWVYVPKGLCDKLTGGSTEPKS